MTLSAIQNRSLSDQVFQQLAGEILAEAYVPDSTLPAERALAEIFGVNRHVVREALKRLEQVGLVKIAQGGATRVLDYRKHAGLDLLALMADGARPGADVVKHWRSMLEMRAAIAADLVRLCAIRADKTVRADLVTVSQQMAALGAEGDKGQEIFALEVRFWDRVHDGADNLAYRLAYNSMIRSVFALPELTQRWSLDEVKRAGYRVELAQMIAKGDAEGAETATRKAMRKVVDAFSKQIAPLMQGAAPAAQVSVEKSSASASRKKKQG